MSKADRLVHLITLMQYEKEREIFITYIKSQAARFNLRNEAFQTNNYQESVLKELVENESLSVESPRDMLYVFAKGINVDIRLLLLEKGNPMQTM